MHIIKRLKFSAVDKLGIISLLSGFAIASVVTIWAIYLESFLHNASYVGFITSFLTIIGIASYVLLTPSIEKSNKINLYAITILIYLASYLSFAIFPNIYAVIILGLIVSLVGSLRITLFGIIFRDKIRDNSVAKDEGMVYTVTNISWLIAPIIAGFIANKYGMQKVFLFASIIFFIVYILFGFFKIKDNQKAKKIDKHPIALFKNFFKSKKRVYSYFLSGGIDFWWALIYIYIPIYIIESKFNEEVIGYFLGAVVIPLVLTEYYFGKFAGKHGFKKIFIAGYLILGVAAISAFFISNQYMVLLVLVLASFGAGMLEPTTEAYFFDVITKKQRDRYYGTYNTTSDFSGFLGKFIPAVFLLFLPFKSIFILFGIVMFIFAILSTKAKDIIEKKK